ncbi:uncharacterized protein [Nicotiana tomentosiformis]|uniref:uncharacterized protein n=1 Tax=Nicotiana tomentosiformis TaxID=4098 RepID=UPI00388C834B
MEVHSVNYNWNQNNQQGRHGRRYLRRKKMAARGMDLTYIPTTIVEGEMIVELVQEDIDSEIDKWKYATITYVIGGSPTIGAMERFLATQGNFSAKPKVIYHNAGNKEFQFLAVYGLHNVQDRKSLWDMLRDMEGKIMGPWLIMGDFNAILGAEDRVLGREVQNHEIKNFRALMEDCSLTELPIVGKSYTWTNGHVYCRIDRAIVNDNWMINMPPLQVHIMNSLFSDLSLLGIEVEGSCDKTKRPFKFYNCMADHPDFGKIVEDNWGLHEGSMEAIWKNLKNVRSALKQLNTKEFMNVAEKIRTIREKLKDIQGK